MGVKGYIMQIQPFSVNDGDGIRSTIFMAGCPLRCKWCCNPEGFTSEPKVGWHERKCIGCGLCEAVCPEKISINMNARRQGSARLERDRCTACGRCVDACPAGARTYMVRCTDADDILREIQKHRIFYSYSGGGITFSGGEATMQTELLDYLSEKIYDMGYNMAIETSCMFDWDEVSHILKRMDMIFADLKLFDSRLHEDRTGAPNERILGNIKRLGTLDSEIVIRIPVIAGVNDDEDNIRKSARFVCEHLPNARMELLPYHEYGRIKYEALGIEYEHPKFRTPPADEMDRLRAIINEEGVELADFR